MSRKFAEKITVEELAKKVAAAVVDHSDFDAEDCEELEGQDISAMSGIEFLKKGSGGYTVRGLLKRLTPRVEKDLSKVQFDTENIEYEAGEGYAEGETGLRVLSNGLAVLGVTAGGDWETPLYFIIYWDGSELRGYIPTDGNPWNTSTKQAYGNDDEEVDEKNIMKRFGVKDSYGLKIDQEKVDADIQGRIAFGGEQT